jgi:hypothetical protein
MAREDRTRPETIKARVGIHVPIWASPVGAGDGNRTRAVSLGIAGILPRWGVDLGLRPVVSGRGCPLVTALNGTLMARRSARDLVFPARRAYPARLIIRLPSTRPKGKRAKATGSRWSAPPDERPCPVALVCSACPGSMVGGMTRLPPQPSSWSG